MIANPPERRRYGELSRAVLVLLNDAPDGLAVLEILDRLATTVPPTPLESQDSPTSPGVTRYEETVRASTAELAKARWLTKSSGTWQITDKGRAAILRFSEPSEFYYAAERRRDPTVPTQAGSAPSDIGDIFAGCFVSLAGSLVGSVIGTIVLFVRMLPDASLALLGGFVAAFVAGVIVGFVASFPIAALADGIGRGVENIWLMGTALAAAISAALTPSLLIAVDAA